MKERLEEAQRAFATLDEIAHVERPSALQRDAALTRFAYTFEAVWKTTRQYLADHEGIDVASPKGCVRAARRVGVLTDEQSEAALVMTDDRNLLVHTYKEPLAVEVFSHLGAHATVLRAWLDAIRTHVEKS